MAEFIDGAIEEGLKTPGATDVTAKYRSASGPRSQPSACNDRADKFSESAPDSECCGRGPSALRKVTFDGGAFVRPTIVLCDSFAHPLANREFLCPYASVVQVPQADMLKQIGYTLAASVITKDPAFIDQVMAYPHIERLNIGPVSTMKISWDQPHEGNMFEFLWQRRSIERAW
ncbi:MAG: hypothetical protein V9H26_09805 [Verrucomicrobiota bacterium]